MNCGRPAQAGRCSAGRSSARGRRAPRHCGHTRGRHTGPSVRWLAARSSASSGRLEDSVSGAAGGDCRRPLGLERFMWAVALAAREKAAWPVEGSK